LYQIVTKQTTCLCTVIRPCKSTYIQTVLMSCFHWRH